MNLETLDQPSMDFSGALRTFIEGGVDSNRKHYRTSILEASRLLGHPGAGVLLVFLESELDSVHTRRAYARHLVEAFRIMRTSLQGLRPEHLVLFREVLLADDRSSSCHAQALSALRSFLGWAFHMKAIQIPDLVAGRLLRIPSVQVSRPFVICTEGEGERLVEEASGLRDRALVLVLLGTGLRVSEVQHLDCSDLIVIDGAPALWVRHGKGGKDRFVPIKEEVSEAIQRYLAADGRQVGGREKPIFLAEDRGVDSRESPRLGAYGIRKILKRHVAQAGISKSLTPHACRHTFGMEFQRRSHDMNVTATVLGHSSLQTTMRYVAHLAIGEMRPFLKEWLRKRGKEE